MSVSSYCLLALAEVPVVTRSRTRPRKSASQQRSRLTVAALLEATARVLVKEGYENASTNKIAAAAGVSIGSLYQYFPSKEALVTAVIDCHKREMVQLLRAAFAKVMPLPVEPAIRELVTAAIEAHRIDPKLHRILAEQIPRMGRLESVEALDREARELVRAYLDRHRAELQVADLDMAAFICIATVESLTHGAVVHRPEALTDKMDLFVEDVTRLVVQYLQHGGPRALPAQPPEPR
jgi:AcrR family transcriptional regulator